MTHAKNIHTRAVEALLESETVATAAQRCGISRKTMYRWLGDKDFQASLRDARSQAYGQAMNRLCHLANKAVSALSDALDGKDVSKTKFLAAKVTLELTSQAITGDMQTRMDEFENQIARIEGNM